MKYLALTDKGAIHSLGDCGDWESANEVAEDCGLDYFYMTALADWIEIADAIKDQQMDEVQANANLIALAPEMIEMLKVCVLQLPDETAEEVSNLIDKAEGEIK